MFLVCIFLLFAIRFMFVYFTECVSVCNNRSLYPLEKFASPLQWSFFNWVLDGFCIMDSLPPLFEWNRLTSHFFTFSFRVWRQKINKLYVCMLMTTKKSKNFFYRSLVLVVFFFEGGSSVSLPPLGIKKQRVKPQL